MKIQIFIPYHYDLASISFYSIERITKSVMLKISYSNHYSVLICEINITQLSFFDQKLI